ncbi:PEP-CTERM sorting domain-containing protein [Actomonas aquatica]|uniref:PEP-CTERM sorting domain-containing protein n=1 Tax=Actomonas aquatica TaxID=2866162 RepID=A0ABZ1C2F1_9BACT|nr:PEP-CTERM sorting domain-containing protein [Opitutus sp. WL0086]WRQ85606.1 PEP-CTERM sorting domain-containing protein [Opitutus sp. WL0086]
MTTSFFSLLRVCAFFMLAGCLQAQFSSVFFEEFNGPTLSSEWEETTPGTYQFDGDATNLTGNRVYIRTAASDFIDHDFSMMVQFTLPESGGANQSMFVGFGSGLPDGSFFHEPHTAIYFRATAPDFSGEKLLYDISASAGTHQESSNLLNPGGGTHMVVLTRIGDTFTMEFDANALVEGSSVELTQSFSVADTLDFLDATNSYLFLGTGGSGVSIDVAAVALSAVPEPSTYAMMAGLVVLGAAGWHRRRRQALAAA